MKTLNSTRRQDVGTRLKGGFFIVAALATLCLIVALCCTGCGSDDRDEVGDMAKAYSQRVTELVYSCTQGKSDAVVEVSLGASDLSFSLRIPAGEESEKTTDRLAAVWTDGTKAKDANSKNRLRSMQYRGCTIK